MPRAAVLSIALALAVLAAGARAEELRLTLENAPSGLVALAVAGDSQPVPATATADGFVWRNLAPGTYNIELKGGDLDVIGVDMRITDASGKRVKTGEAPAATAEVVRNSLYRSGDFYGRRKVPLLAGTGDRAVALIENIQEGDKTSLGAAASKIFYRLDLWEFTKSYGTWRKTATRTFLRRVMNRADFDSITFVYVHELGGVDIAPGRASAVKYAFP